MIRYPNIDELEKLSYLNFYLELNMDFFHLGLEHSFFSCLLQV